jgi:hypothetical protein
MRLSVLKRFKLFGRFLCLISVKAWWKKWLMQSKKTPNHAHCNKNIA